MKKKSISIIIAIIVITAFLLSYIISYANTSGTIYVNLTKIDPIKGVGYGIGNPANGTNVEGQPATNAYIWNLTTYLSDSANAKMTDIQRNLYCVKANYGDTWENSEKGGYNKIIPYNLSYDLQKDRGTLLTLINESTDEKGVVKTLLTEAGYYRELLWILDNSYIENKTNKTEFLANIGIIYDEEQSEAYGVETYIYEPITGYDYSDNVAVTEYFEDNLLTDADIKAVQKAAIWYYTNYMQNKKDDAIFNQRDSENAWLSITTDENGASYTYLAEYLKTTGVGPQRAAQAQILYNYLIDAAEDNAGQYVSDNDNDYNDGDYMLQKALDVDTEGLTEIDTGNEDETKYRLTTTRIGSNYVVGPIKIKKNNNSINGISIQVTDPTADEESAELTYTFAKQNGETLGVTTLKELLEKTEVGQIAEFYISVSRTSAEKINIKINVTEETTSKTLWLRGTENLTENEITSISLIAEQPLVEVDRGEKTVTTEFEAEPNEFDLALRKYITSLHKKDENGKYTVEKPILNAQGTSNVRTLNNIDLKTLNSGTTAEYKHRKDPVVVEDGDEVTYKIRIYNEGNNAGYATQIIDQLPTGLIWSTNNSNTITAIRSDNTEGNTYTYASNAKDISDNKVILKMADTTAKVPLKGYTTGNLEYETIEIKCKVVQEPDITEQIILTNVAWISEAYDSDTGRIIPDESEDEEIDRDSKPDVSPSVDKSNMKNYRGNGNNIEDLSEDVYHYGEQDDDDFEKLVIMPVDKIFDLELVKFIAAVSKDAKIDEGEYLTNTKNSDGIYDRAPKISIVKEQDSEKRRIHCDWTPSNKTPVLVEAGDYVLYTIRVYNAGEIDGYASLIKDHLPLGLEFAETTDETAEFWGIWNVDEYVDANGDERQILSTDELAQGQGKEAGATESDENYRANLLKALKVDEDVTDGENRNPDYRDVQVLCKVTDDAQKNSVLVNYAQISQDKDKNGKDIEDEDSTPNNLPEDGPHEDDEDLEKIQLQAFDLSLRKFITAINDDELKNDNKKYMREPIVNVTPLKNGTSTTAIYNHPKNPVGVQVGDKVVYTIRVYNEGDINGYASKVTDYLPPYLTYDKNSQINKDYEWEISDNGRIATTDYLANSELKAFDGTKLDYADLKIACIVSDSAPVKQNQTNIAEISEYKYNGNTVPRDIDSESDNMTDENKNYMPEDNNLPSYKNDEINEAYVPGNEDDDDFEKIYVKFFDLSLRKFVSAVNGESLNGVRAPIVDVTPLKDGTGTTAIYKHPKTPLALKIGDKVIYTIRVYNEGEIAGYANKVTDYLPPYLTFDKDSQINKDYGWQISDNGRIATTTYLSTKEISEFDGTKLDYEDIQIECIISDKAIAHQNITNIAEISEYKYGETVVPKDIDSESDNMTDEDKNYMPEDEKLPSYKDEEKEKEYIPGNEDDDDFEKIYVKEFDLALRKFITKVQENEVTTRVPQVKMDKTISYEHPKDAITVHVGDIVIYTLRIFNEGEIDGYASEITDDIPEYLEYLPKDSTNIEFKWKMYDKDGKETENVEEAVKVKTTYLSKENGEDNLIKAFDGKTLDYKDVKIAFKVKDPNSNTQIITNYAQISDDEDENGDEVTDKDSKPNEWNEGEDDQDIENIKVEYFDLSLLKFVTKVIVIEEGKETITETGDNGHEDPEPVVKVELHKKKLDKVVVKFGYGITITNESDIPGYATEITDYVPEGLKFNPDDNPEWTDEGNNVISTRQLEGKLLQPGESATIEVILTWINGADNLSLKTNIAEISEDDNEYDVPDRDSTPDNKKDGEDDIDIAKVILSITTGAGKTYFTLAFGLLAIIATGVILIKKFVI